MARRSLDPRRRARHRAALGGLATAGTLLVAGIGAGSAQAVELVKSDAEFILAQIQIAEADAATPGVNDLPTLIGNPQLPLGLRTVTGAQNNLGTPAQQLFGSADRVFPRLLPQVTRTTEDSPGGIFPATPGGQPQSYAPTGPGGLLYDSQPRVISNLISDQDSNPAAIAARAATPGSGAGHPSFIPNANNDGVSAPYNSWFTLFGQFFDHGLDLVAKGDAGTVFIPLKPDDPLIAGPNGIFGDSDDLPANRRFMTLTRATGALEHTNVDSPFIDQSQTYTSHPSHQVFLREYALNAAGKPISTGRLLDGPVAGSMPNWADVKEQARTKLGIQLRDVDVLNVPLLVTDDYGRFVPGPNGFAQIQAAGGPIEGDPLANGGLGVLVPDAATSRTGHAFLDDIAHSAAPGSFTSPKAKDANTIVNPPGPPLPAGEYDDELLDAHFIAGDGRANENIGLTSVHFLFHAEHNRLVKHLQDDVITPSGDPAFIAQWKLPSGEWNGERLFQAARFATEMQYQHAAFEEFARKVSPAVHPFGGYDTTIDPAIVAEFAHTVYRFGHSMLTETVDRKTAAGGNNPIGLIQAFLNPVEFTASGATPGEAAGNIIAGMAGQTGNELDEFVTGALRDNLVGLPLDLAALNITRARETRVPALNQARAVLTSVNGANLPAYTSWAEFRAALRHPQSAINFIAAYGIDPSLTATTFAARRTQAAALISDSTFMNAPAAQTGVDDIDFWIGGLAEKPIVGQLLGPTFNFVFQNQMERLQDGDRLYYLHRLPGTAFAAEIEANSLAEMVRLNTSGATHLPADIFSVANFTFEMAHVAPGGPGPIPNNPATSVDESLLTRTNTDVISFNDSAFPKNQHVVMGGTAGDDKMRAGGGDDTLWGEAGADTLEGGDGVDTVIGGDGNDTLSDAAGLLDTLKGGHGNDVLRGGIGADVLLPGAGDDFVVAGVDGMTTLSGAGRDFLLGGAGPDAETGGDGDDWMEGGAGGDTLVGGLAAPLHAGVGAGNDVMDGGAGVDLIDGEGGDDIVINSPEADSNEGLIGFDWMTHARDTTPADSDLAVFLPPVNPLDNRDRFVHTEGLSGSPQGDTLKGTSAADPADPLSAPGQNDITNPGLIVGLQGVLDMRAGAASTTFSGANGGNILLGGGGPDLLEGRGGNDLIDGDAQLDVTVSGQNTLAGPLQAGIQPGDIAGLTITRSITLVPGIGDVAIFSGPVGDYDITPANGGARTIAHNRGTRADGTDTVRNVEALQFADPDGPGPATGLISLTGGNFGPSGSVTVNPTAPVEGQAVTATKAFIDLDGIVPGSVIFSWEARVGAGTWTSVGATGPTFTPGNNEVGKRLRAVASYVDGLGQAASVISAQTAPVVNVNDPATGAPAISGANPTVGEPLTASKGTMADLDGLPPDAGITYTWQVSTSTGWAPADSGPTFTPDALHVGRRVRVIASFTDQHGTAESRTSAQTAAIVAAPVAAPPAPPAPPAPAAPPAAPAAPTNLAPLSISPPAPPAPPPTGPTTLSLTSFTVVPAGARSPLVVSFVLNAPATVTFEVRRPDDALVRRIVHRDKNGKVTLKWNLLDGKGRHVKPGRYRVKVDAVSADRVTATASKTVRVR